MQIRKLTSVEAGDVFGRLEERERLPRAPRPAAPRVPRGSRVPLTLERASWEQGVQHVVGVDEVGVGSICAALFAAAVELPPDVDEWALADVRDSKLIGHASTRRRLDRLIREHAARIGLGAASPGDIERLRDGARGLAMERALLRLGHYDVAFIDGPPFLSDTALAGPRHVFMSRGESVSLSVACAAIIAKVARDRLLERLAARYPGYLWERNAGYPTAEHRAALRALGPTPHHRLWSRVVRAALRA